MQWDSESPYRMNLVRKDSWIILVSVIMWSSVSSVLTCSRGLDVFVWMSWEGKFESPENLFSVSIHKTPPWWGRKSVKGLVWNKSVDGVRCGSCVWMRVKKGWDGDWGTSKERKNNYCNSSCRGKKCLLYPSISRTLKNVHSSPNNKCVNIYFVELRQ